MTVPQHGDRTAAVGEIVQFANSMRARILYDGLARSATVNGVIPDNTFEEVKRDGGLRRAHIQVVDLSIQKALSPDFRLFIKHPAIFTVLAKELERHLPVYAVIRHPLAVLASWSTVDTSVQGGRWPVAEAFAPDLKQNLDGIEVSLDRQIAILRWILRIYRDLPPERVLKYEHIVRDPVSALLPLTGTTNEVCHPIYDFHPSTRYPNANLANLAKALYEIADDVEPFYCRFKESLIPYFRKVI